MKLVYLIPLFFIFGCANPEGEVSIPNDIISKEKMILVFKDIHIAESLTAEKKIKDVKLSNQMKKSYLVSVLKKHNISKEEFEKSFAFYEDHVDLMYNVYNDVMIKISEQEAELEGKKVDSLTNK